MIALSPSVDVSVVVYSVSNCVVTAPEVGSVMVLADGGSAVVSSSPSVDVTDVVCNVFNFVAAAPEVGFSVL